MPVIHEVSSQVQWNEGEDGMHKLLRVPPQENPSSPFLTPYGANLLVRCPLIALGTLDEEGRPWTTVIGGEAGFSRPIAQSFIGIKTLVDRNHDPVLETLLWSNVDGEPVKVEGKGKMMSGLAIDLENRNRVKLYGRMVGGALTATTPGVGEIQLAVKIEQSLANCPKYLNKKKIVPQIPQPKLVSDSLPLSPQAMNLLAKADTFFMSSSNSITDMDTNIRGGPPGFLRIISNSADNCTLIYPEYSGNRLYQTLGNLRTTPQAGLVFPDFETGDVLYVTGKTEILIGSQANEILPRSNLAVKIHVSAVGFVSNGLGFRGEAGEASPYNPPIRFLSTEKPVLNTSSNEKELKLLDRKMLTPTIARFRFGLVDSKQSITWKPGQYAMINLEEEMNIGYSHMRDGDPRSLNDDFLRTFTISNLPYGYNDDSRRVNGTKEFEISIRNVGAVTSFLFRHNLRTDLSLSLFGISGSFFFEQSPDSNLAIIAGGIGITPLLAQAPTLDLQHLSLFWSVAYEDIGLVVDTFERIPGLAKSTIVFVTGKAKASDKLELESKNALERIRGLGADVKSRRLKKGDLEVLKSESADGKNEVNKWYICTSKTLRTQVTEWLEGATILFEDFSY